MSLQNGSRDDSRDDSTTKQKPTPAAGERRLDDFLCFAIYSANLAYGRAYKPGLDELGLTYPQWIAIVALWEQDDQTVSELGNKMFLESNTLTPILKKLEAMGYLRRQRDPADERQVRVSLTDAGRRLREKGMHMNLVKSSGLKPDEFAQLQKTVVRLRDNLIKAMEEE
ncbi:MarR family transcriptional regulator [Bradyrhizobium sp. WYCCWR 13023]|uniref:MarR family transcriptional regulator n=1 Tax=Bradyrhizobium zhengyangense TaxID=2911009 RepID=A0A9X1RDD0_9BRAD|nr:MULTISPECIES: MarR family transcriptional regulator [Bradyrhizobium]MCG2629861.1 MarR family transcriptional regulator [Bradyrhizobium zhengyangense]MCG2642460.1 MarR family transcriptional regulator [Bradyrhizobium zhengyangense]MCG2667647.1 MarR family transcriptional regulator [Bradyrhizobium zhengyangense]